MKLIEALKTIKEYCNGRECNNCMLRVADDSDSYTHCYMKTRNPSTWEIKDEVEVVPRIFE